MYTPGNKKEIPDKTPVELPVGYHPPETLEAMIARLVRYESSRAEKVGQETFEEADDFEVADDAGEFHSPYQMTDMQEEAPFERTNPNKRDAPKAGKAKEGKAKETTTEVVENPKENVVVDDHATV